MAEELRITHGTKRHGDATRNSDYSGGDYNPAANTRPMDSKKAEKRYAILNERFALCEDEHLLEIAKDAYGAMARIYFKRFPPYEQVEPHRLKQDLDRYPELSSYIQEAVAAAKTSQAQAKN